MSSLVNLHRIMKRGSLRISGVALAAGIGSIVVCANGVVTTNEFSDTRAIAKISWQSESNAAYVVEWSTNLTEAVWSNLCDEVEGNGQTIWVYDAPQDAKAKIYRVMANP